MPVADSLLRSYQSRAHGRVYFYLDRRNSDARTLVKTDQIALEVFWEAPNRTKQRIVGLRDESRLPNRMRYHLDHLTVVQNEFGDAIRLGDGDEVRDVPHPAAAGSDSIYDFRLADSLTIRLPGAPEPVRAYEIEVRPKRTDRPAIVGSLYVDRASADIVRMTFTFTPVSYVDPRLDYINISLDNSLWEGRYWLPYEQSVEIRRQIPELDFIAGAVILGRFRISDYQLNIDLPPRTFVGFRVESLPPEQRRAYPFESGLYDELGEVGLGPPPSMAELRAEAARLLGLPSLSGLPDFRLSLGAASEVFRFDRAESAFLGTGVSWAPGPWLRTEVSAGFASGPEHGAAAIGIEAQPPGGPGVELRGYFNDIRDLGIRPGAAGAISTLAAMTDGRDYRDPWYVSGVRAAVQLAGGPDRTLFLEARSERHRSAMLTRERAPFAPGERFRPVRAVDEGWLHAIEAAVERPEPIPGEPGIGLRLALEAGLFDGDPYLRPTARAVLQRSSADLRTHLRVRAAGGLAFTLDGSPLAAQHRFLLGGRNTLPGYEYRSFGGDAFALVDASVGRDVAWPWLRLHASAALGAAASLAEEADLAGTEPVDWRRDWGVGPTDGLRPSVGIGAGMLWDILRLDIARGLRDGEWQFLFSVSDRLWGLL